MDRDRALRDLAKDSNIDVITGDWMSEGDMAINAPRVNELKQSIRDTSELGNIREGYHANFLTKIQPALQSLTQNGTKVVCNAGGSNPHGLAVAVKELIEKEGLGLRVAWIEGDDVTDSVSKLIESGADLVNINSRKRVADWKKQPKSAQCYLGAFGIARALQDADIVLCGRVADSSPCIGAAIWWHGWTENNLDELAASLVAGHLIECGTYATGGCYAGFKKFGSKIEDFGFPIAHIDHRGGVEITKEHGKDGEVSVGTLSSQLVYEIQGPLYYNSSVTANLENLRLDQVGEDRVRVSGVQGLPPPPTTKAGLTATAGFRAEYHVYLSGLDLEEKLGMLKAQIIAGMGPENYARFSLLKFQVAGIPDPNARSQEAATVDVRIFAQTTDPDLLQQNQFLHWSKMHVLQCPPGLTPITDPRQGVGRPYYEYWPTLIDQSLVKERVHLAQGQVVDIPPPAVTQVYPAQQKSYETENPLPLDSWGPTQVAPLGYIALGRSGDKASDANVGFFVRHDDEWDWLRCLLTVEKMKDLLGDDYEGKPIDRFEMAGLRAVHFLLHDHLNGGYNSGYSLDILGKNLIEYLRAKPVEIPTRFLERGRV